MKLSSAQAALLHTGESAASSAIMTLVIGIWQQIATGQISWSQLFIVFGSGFVGALGLIYKSVASSPSLKQAEADTTNEAIAEAKSLAMMALNHIESIWPALHSLNSAVQNQQAATKPVQPVSAPQPVQPQITPVVSSSGVASVGQVPFAVPQRSFTQSALMPAVTPKS